MADDAPDRRLNAYRTDLAETRLRAMVEAARYVEGAPARILTPSAPLRRAPAADAPLDTELLRGAGLLVLDEADGWAWIRALRDSYVGYVPAEALGPYEPVPTHRVAALATFVFPAPDMKRPPLARLTFGAMVHVAAKAGDFAVLADGTYVWRNHLAPQDTTESDMVAVATRLLGTPYLWGGRTADGIDCSGLVQFAAEACGLDCPRDSDMQAAGLGGLLPADMVPERGDLVFWKGHVGLVSGPGRLLHANAFHMAVAEEPLAEAVARMAAQGLHVTAMRRPH